jgi:hypothetical protein
VAAAQRQQNILFIRKRYRMELNVFICRLTLLAYIVQFIKSSESIPPSKPNNAPEAPTEIPDCMNRADSTVPPKPDITYRDPILTAKR